MSPDLLTLARATPLGPYVPATWDLIGKISAHYGDAGWIGPGEAYGNGFTVRDHVDRWDVAPLAECIGFVQDNEGDEAVPRNVRLDCRRGEVRDLLVRLGLLPHALRDHPGAAVAAGMGARVEDVLRAYVPSDLLVGGVPQLWIRRSELTRLSVLVAADGWSISRNGVHTWDRADYAARGREAGPAGKLAADLAALRLGCVLEEPDGYLIPLPDGGVGFVSKESP